MGVVGIGEKQVSTDIFGGGKTWMSSRGSHGLEAIRETWLVLGSFAF